MRHQPSDDTAQEPSAITKAVVPAAGKGTRLLPATRSQPKEMLPVGRKPTIQHVVEELAAAGLQEVLLISGQGKRAIEDHLDRGVGEARDEHQPWMDLHFFHARQSVPRGLADAISVAEPFVANQPFVVALGDSIVVSKSPQPLLRRMVAVHAKHRPAAARGERTASLRSSSSATSWKNPPPRGRPATSPPRAGMCWIRPSSTPSGRPSRGSGESCGSPTPCAFS